MPTETQWEDIPEDVREKILKARDAVIDCEPDPPGPQHEALMEVYHWLYKIADPSCTLTDPWRDQKPLPMFKGDRS